MMLRCYSELLQIPTFKERYEYLRLDGVVGEKLLFVIMDVILDWMVTRFVERFLFIT